MLPAGLRYVRRFNATYALRKRSGVSQAQCHSPINGQWPDAERRQAILFACFFLSGILRALVLSLRCSSSRSGLMANKLGSQSWLRFLLRFRAAIAPVPPFVRFRCDRTSHHYSAYAHPSLLLVMRRVDGLPEKSDVACAVDVFALFVLHGGVHVVEGWQEDRFDGRNQFFGVLQVRVRLRVRAV